MSIEMKVPDLRRFADGQLQNENDVLKSRIQNTRKILKQIEFLAASMSAYSKCIGMNLCHVDGNCAHCSCAYVNKIAINALEELKE